MTTGGKLGTKQSENKQGKEETTGRRDECGSNALLSASSSLTLWTRQQKLITVAALGMVGVLLGASACSKEGAKPALVGVASPSTERPAGLATAAAGRNAMAAMAPAPVEKLAKKRPKNVTYKDDAAGISFQYPRKFTVKSEREAGEDAAVREAEGDLPLNFVQPGGVEVARVAMPENSFPGTDFGAAFFRVNVNRNISEEECSHFGFVDSRNADGEAVDAERVTVGEVEMDKTSDFVSIGNKQDERQYYHSFENGACYEYVLGLATEGENSGDSKHVDRDKVFAKLESILNSVRVKPVEAERGAEQAAVRGAGKE